MNWTSVAHVLLTTDIEEPDLDQIRESNRAAAQGIIDLVTKQFDRVISQEREAGEIRGQRGRSINVASGLQGSDFASANAEKIESANRKVVQSIEAERDAKIASILSGVESRSKQEFQEQRKNFIAQAEGAVDQIDSLQKREREIAERDIKLLAASGMS